MPIAKTGAISLLTLQNEFGGSTPIGINEYYRSGSIVTSPFARGQDNALLPSSGAVNLLQYLGARNGYYFANDYTYSPGGTDATITTLYQDPSILASGNHQIITPASTHDCVIGLTANVVVTNHTVTDVLGSGFVYTCDREASACVEWDIGSSIRVGFLCTIGRVYDIFNGFSNLTRYGIVWELFWYRRVAGGAYQEYWGIASNNNYLGGVQGLATSQAEYTYFTQGQMKLRLRWNNTNYGVYLTNGSGSIWLNNDAISYGSGLVNGSYAHPRTYFNNNMYIGAFQHFNSGSNSRTISNPRFSRDTSTIYTGFGY